MNAKDSKKPETETAIVKAEPVSSAVSVIDDQMLYDAQHASGFENVKTEDVAIPFLKILQALSPQVRGATKIPGASEGDFFNTVTEEVLGKVVSIVPCAYLKAFVEWVPREQGGGFVKQYFDSAILGQTKKNEKGNDVLPNGNHIVTTAYHYCLVVKTNGSHERIVASMTSTQLKKSRRWLSQMMSLQISVGDKKITPPMFSNTYEVTSKEESNDFGSWHGYVIGAPKLITDKQLYLAAKKFHSDVTSGAIKTAEPLEVDDVPVTPVTTSDVQDKF
jgi:hypothetical protein